MIIYGLSTCSACQKAQKALEAAGSTITFRDVRAEPLTEVELEDLLMEFGDRLVERTTNDYRALSAWLKNSEADSQISSKPKVMARPVIQDGDRYYLGWTDEVQQALLAD
jgi:arsenate reductase-like glutaredoxin family protein